MKGALIAATSGVLALAISLLFEADPYKISEIGHAHDQAVLEHRDSAYTHITWVTSAGDNYAQLRFFDRIEGGICLEPTWASYPELAQRLAAAERPATLDHLIPNGPVTPPAAPGPTWPEGMPHPDPGTLSHTAYVTLYPAAVELSGTKAPRVLIVGLGSGVGAAVLLHHYPDAHITFVDIDQVVIDSVLDHYPLMNWLTEQGRIDMVAADARQYLKKIVTEHAEGDAELFDMIVLDAYTAGSTIPPHLMTREFYAKVADALTPNGVCLSNIIGSYTGKQRDVLGGAMRSMLATGEDGGTGFTSVFNLPVIRPMHDNFNPGDPRNNIVLAARHPLDPTSERRVWRAMQQWRPYRDLAAIQEQGEWVSVSLIGRDNQRASTSALSLQANATDTNQQALIAAIRDRLPGPSRSSGIDLEGDAFYDRLHGPNGDLWYFTGTLESADITELWPAISPVLDGIATTTGKPARGWDTRPQRATLMYVDWLGHAQLVWQRSIEEAKRPATATAFAHDARVLLGEGGELEDTPLFTDQTPNADIFNR